MTLRNENTADFCSAAENSEKVVPNNCIHFSVKI